MNIVFHCHKLLLKLYFGSLYLLKSTCFQYLLPVLTVSCAQCWSHSVSLEHTQGSLMASACVVSDRLEVCFISSVHYVAFRAHWMDCAPSADLACGTADMCRLSNALVTIQMVYVRLPVVTRYKLVRFTAKCPRTVYRSGKVLVKIFCTLVMTRGSFYQELSEELGRKFG